MKQDFAGARPSGRWPILITLLAFVLAGCTSTGARTTSTTASAVGAACHERNGLPDPSCTPGATNPAVTQANIHSTICVSGWTATIRPPVSYTDRLKRLQMQAYGLPGSTGLYEEDHLVPLEIGGNPTSSQNLWPEPWAGTQGAHAKDRVENTIRRAVCDGTTTLAAAQSLFEHDWENG